MQDLNSGPPAIELEHYISFSFHKSVLVSRVQWHSQTLPASSFDGIILVSNTHRYTHMWHARSSLTEQQHGAHSLSLAAGWAALLKNTGILRNNWEARRNSHIVFSGMTFYTCNTQKYTFQFWLHSFTCCIEMKACAKLVHTNLCQQTPVSSPFPSEGWTREAIMHLRFLFMNHTSFSLHTCPLLGSSLISSHQLPQIPVPLKLSTMHSQ